MSAGGDKRLVADGVSARANYGTPRPLVRWIETDIIHDEFTLDAAADSTNAVCPVYYTEEDNSLIMPWFGNVWLNPPYGRMMKPFIRKCISEWQSHNVDLIVALVPDNGDTQWYNEAVDSDCEVLRFKHRIQFIPPPGVKQSTNTGGSALFIWRERDEIESIMRMIEWPKDRRK